MKGIMTESATKFLIDIPCADCDGNGSTEQKVAPDIFHFAMCEVCFGAGFITHEEAYDSMADANVDYPNAVEIREAKK